jgi:predicted nucleic acid-binding protein
MASKLFLDANFLLDFTLQRAGYSEVKEIVKMGVNGDIQLCTTPAIIHITAYWLAKTYTKKKAKTIIMMLMNDLQVIDCDHETVLLALSSNIEDIEDALQYYTAITHDVDIFISSDKLLKKSAIPRLPVLTPGEFLKEIRDQGNGA